MNKLVRFIQTLPTFSEADAIGNNVCAIHSLLLEHGYESFISASNTHNPSIYVVSPLALKNFIDPARDIIIQHMAIGADINEAILQYPCRKRIMVYHNITPSQFFYNYDTNVAELCRIGREQLKKINKYFNLAIADSEYNAAELREAGYKNVVTVPLLVDFFRYDAMPLSDNIISRYDDGKRNILFVGRGVPNKCQHDIAAAFSRFRQYFPDSRLLLAGGWLEPYRRHVQRLIAELRLEDSVVLLGTVSDSELKTLYQISHLFLCMSEHEGFCVPLLEAMRFGVPVLAFAAAAVPDTLGDSGVLFYEKDFDAVAKMMALIVEDKELRDKIISAQKNRLAVFAQDKVKALLLEHLCQPLSYGDYMPGVYEEDDALPAALPIKKLLSMNGKELIRHAYARMLHRLPDPEGENAFYAKLLEGFPPVSLISALRFSPEGRGVAEPVKHAFLLRWCGRLLGSKKLPGKIARYLASLRFLSATRNMSRVAIMRLQEQEAQLAAQRNRIDELEILLRNQADFAANMRHKLNAVEEQANSFIASAEQSLQAQSERLNSIEQSLQAQSERLGSIEQNFKVYNERSNSIEQTLQTQADRACAIEQTLQIQIERRGDDENKLASLLQTLEEGLNGVKKAMQPPMLPFSHDCGFAPYLRNAEQRMKQKQPSSIEGKKDLFYSFFRVMGAEQKEILNQHYEAYLPHLPTKSNLPFLDIGCGSGDFLSFMQEHSIKAIGIDINETEAARSRERGFAVHHAEAIDFLKQYDGALSGISLLQVIEHIPQERHIELLSLANEKLSDNGVLIIETINPAHPLAFNGFFTDPTHARPVSADYLAFMTQWCGFRDTNILYLYPVPVLQSAISDTQLHYYNYAIVARKGETAG